MSVTVMVATAPEAPALVLSKDAVLVRPDGSTVWVAVRNETSQAVAIPLILSLVMDMKTFVQRLRHPSVEA
jgi:hypothetical protein